MEVVGFSGASKFSGKHNYYNVIDGLIEEIIQTYAREAKILNLDKYQREHGIYPEFEVRGSENYVDPKSYDIYIGSEPTFCMIGKAIREEITKNNSRDYSADFTARAFSKDRLIWYKRVVLPLLKAGRILVQSRSVLSSIIFQSIQAQKREENLEVNYIVNLSGNRLALDNAPDVIIIPTIVSAELVMKRLQAKDGKIDDSLFENLKFQESIKPFYESQAIKEYFEGMGTKVRYVSAEGTMEEVREEVAQVYREIFG